MLKPSNSLVVNSSRTGFIPGGGYSYCKEYNAFASSSFPYDADVAAAVAAACGFRNLVSQKTNSFIVTNHVHMALLFSQRADGSTLIAICSNTDDPDGNCAELKTLVQTWTSLNLIHILGCDWLQTSTPDDIVRLENPQGSAISVSGGSIIIEASETDDTSKISEVVSILRSFSPCCRA